MIKIIRINSCCNCPFGEDFLGSFCCNHPKKKKTGWNQMPEDVFYSTTIPDDCPLEILPELDTTRE